MRVIYRIADRHPDWGGRQIAWFLRRLKWSKLHVAPSTVYEHLAKRRGPDQEGGPGRRNRYCFRPGVAWALDFCSLKAGEVTASLLLVIDDCTRRVVAWQLMTTRSTGEVLATLQSAFQREGTTPVLIKADNGPEFRHGFQTGLAACSVAVLHSPFFYAPFNGKVERAFRAPRRFLRFRAPAVDLAALKQQIARWVWEHNSMVVSQSLGRLTPLEAGMDAQTVFAAVPGQEIISPECRADDVVVRFKNRRGGKPRLRLPRQVA